MKIRRDLAWHYWLATAVLLAFGLAGIEPAFAVAMALVMLQAAHFAYRSGRFTAFAVQVRLAYLGLLLLGQWEPLRFLNVLQLAGTSAMVVFGYCPLARFLALMPWNRAQPLSLQLIWRIVSMPPVPGSIVHAVSGAEESAQTRC